MKVLGVYGSNFGQAETVLRRIIAVLESHGHEVTVLKGDALPADLAIEDFEAVIVAASIGPGGYKKHIHYQKYIYRFVREHADALKSRASAFISVNGTCHETLPAWQAASRQYIAEFLQDVSWKPQWTAGFAGALSYSKYGFVTRMVMKYLSGRSGGPTDTSKDYEFTDWDAVDRFAIDLSAGLVRQPVAATTERSVA